MQLYNNFNGGPDGAAMTTSNTNQLGDNGFDLVQASTGSTLAFADAGVAGLNRPTAAFCMRTATPGSGDTAYVAWTSGIGTQTELWVRVYIQWSSLASTSTNRLLFGVYSSFSRKLSLLLRTSASPFTLQLQDSASAFATMSTAITAGTWNRIELHMNATTDTAELYLFANTAVDNDLSDYTEMITQSSVNYGTTVNQFFLGMPVSYNEVTTSCYFSGLGVNNTGLMGPAPFRGQLGWPGNFAQPTAIHSDVS